MQHVQKINSRHADILDNPQLIGLHACAPTNALGPSPHSGQPLHADITALLLARGAAPLRPHNGIPS